MQSNPPRLILLLAISTNSRQSIGLVDRLARLHPEYSEALNPAFET